MKSPVSGHIGAHIGARVGRALLLLVVASAFPHGPAYAEDRVGGSSISSFAHDAVSDVPSALIASGLLLAPDGRELWARDSDTRRSMASTTKIMTAVLVLERTALDEQVVVSARAASVGESAAGLRAGDTLTVRKMLEALLVRSGNDASVALAEHVSGSLEAFVKSMNERAAELGLDDTSFANPHGLDAPGHYATARDLGVLTQHAMGFDEFRRIVALQRTTIDGASGPRELEASNRLIGTFTGATGVKTGWTNGAGYCLVGTAQRHGVELMAVVLGARGEQSRFSAAEDLLEWGFEHYGRQVLASAEETQGTVIVSDYLDVTVEALLAEGVTVPVFDMDGEIERRLMLPAEVAAPLEKGDRLGTLSFSQGDRLLVQVPVVAAETVERPGLAERMWIAVVRWWRGLRTTPATAS